MSIEIRCCNICKINKHITDFYQRKASKDGYSPRCKICSDRTTKRSRLKKYDHYSQVKKEYQHRNVERINKWKSETGCLTCRKEFHPTCLEFHHLDGNSKDHQPSVLIRHTPAKFRKEVQKCILLCANCHRKVHANILNIDKYHLEMFGIYLKKLDAVVADVGIAPS